MILGGSSNDGSGQGQLHQDAVRHIRFSQPDGAYLLTVGQDYMHTIGVWDTKTGQLLAFTRGGEAKVFDVHWAPNGGGGSFVQVGFQHIKFHTVRGRNIDTEMGVFGDEDVPFSTMCVGYVKTIVLLLVTDGSFSSLKARDDVVVPEAFLGGQVCDLHRTRPPHHRGYDGKIRMWSLHFSLVATSYK